MEDEYYIASHLLKEGFNGTIYQLNVLLWCMIKLLNKKQNFRAMVEVKDKGILDDIIIIKDSEIKKK
ncbi:MAG: hypothetical protein ACK4PR_10525 [Gammaproteobacteria bacterium]